MFRVVDLSNENRGQHRKNVGLEKRDQNLQEENKHGQQECGGGRQSVYHNQSHHGEQHNVSSQHIGKQTDGQCGGFDQVTKQFDQEHRDGNGEQAQISDGF